MTAAIIEDEKQKKEVYEFLDEDDDFEEFEENDDDGGLGSNRMEIDMLHEDPDTK